MIRPMQPRQFTSVQRLPVFAVNIVLAALVAAGGLWAYQTVWGTTPAAAVTSANADLATVTTADVTATVSTSGTVASSDVVAANFTTSGTVTKIYVKLGDHVTKGQTIARIDSTASNEQLQTAEDNLTSAQDSLDRAETSKDTASIDTAQTQVDTAEDTVTSAKAAVAGCVLKAPITGTVIAQNGVVGASSGASSSSSSSGGGGGNNSSSSTSSTGFMQIADLTKMEADTDFPEADATKLKVGMDATITWNALTGATATGKVESIDPTATTSNNVVSYGVVVKLTSLPDGIRIGQSTTVVVTTASVTGVTAVLTSAVTTTGNRSTVTLDGSTLPTVVQVGVVGDTYTEITSGLTVGQKVVLPAAKTATTSTNPFVGFGGGGLGGGGLGGGGFAGAGGGTGRTGGR
jgi:membrane fusion protein, macrolide-specific efflux system